MDKYEEFDVENGDAEDFEDFDVMQEPEIETEAETTAESLAGLAQSDDHFKSLMAARDELEQKLMPDSSLEAMTLSANEAEQFGLGNIVGVGVGLKEVDGFLTNELVVVCLVKEKRKENHVASEAYVPSSLSGVATDVQAVGEIRAQMFTARRRPAPGGVSIGNCARIHAGTLGCLVTRNNRLFILSNNHVMALSNAAPIGSAISQPGRLDGGVCPPDIIARLTQFIPINFANNAQNRVDAAIARTSPRLVNRRILRPNGVLQPIGKPATGINPQLLTLVQKSGRTTQHTAGLIDLINATINVNFNIGIARFVRQFRVTGLGGSFSAPGDSGSLVTSLIGNQPVGLLFAGNSVHTFCNPIRPVLGAFGVQIVT